MTDEEKTIAKSLWENVRFLNDRDQRFLRILEKRFLDSSQIKLSNTDSDRLYGIKRRYEEVRA